MGAAAAALLASAAVASSAANSAHPSFGLRPNATATASAGNQPNPLLVVINQNTSNTAGGIYGQDGGTTQFTLGFPFGTAGVYSGGAGNQGVGLFGFGNQNGTGVVGLGQSQPGVFAGNTASTGSTPGLSAVSVNGDGVDATSQGGGNGVAGMTSASPPPNVVVAGVSGFDMSGGGSGSAGQNFGVFGRTMSTNSFGTVGLGGTPSMSGTTGPRASGVLALAFGGGDGLVAQSVGQGGSSGAVGGTAILGTTDSPNAFALSLSNSSTLMENFSADGPGFLFQASAGTGLGGTTAGNGFGRLDTSGNLTISGRLTTGSGTVVNVARGASGTQYETYSAHVTRPTQEDVGRSQLVNGNGSVRFDADFANVIDRGSDYAVFLTPEGDNRGLYVAQRTPTGFVVRESQSGRSTLAFSYRIVATPFASTERRLPRATGLRDLSTRTPSVNAATKFAAAARFTSSNARFPQAHAGKMPLYMVHPTR